MSQAVPIHSVYPFIEFQARLHPHAPAVIHESHTIRYAEFCTHVDRVTRRLHAQQIAPDVRVAVHVDNPYLRWLAVLALGRLGLLCATLSQTGIEAPIVRAGVVVTDRESAASAPRTITMGTDWLSQEADSLPPFADVPRSPDHPLRIMLSSGTTGKPKMALLTVDSVRGRMRGAARAYGLNALTRLMVTMGQNTLGGYLMPVTCWAAGGAVVLPHLPRGEGMTHLLRQSPNVLVMATAQLAALVDSLPRDSQPVPDLVVYVGGAELTRSLSRRARLRLTPSVYVIYGSTEAGGVSLAHAASADTRPGFTGHVMPTTVVEIVDDARQPVAPGTLGELRIRSEGMFAGYLDDEGRDDSPLQEGWFYPGDAGTLDAQGGLSVLGRTRELMNLGGGKVAPTLVEEALASLPGVDDVAVFAIETPNGARAVAAVVAGDDFVDESVAQRFRQAFPTLPAIVLAKVPSIPRNDMGKVMRADLAASVQKKAGSIRRRPA